MANFLEVSCTDEIAKDIADRCSFQNLKNVDKAFPADFMKKVQEYMRKIPDEEKPTDPVIYRKGEYSYMKYN